MISVQSEVCVCIREVFQSLLDVISSTSHDNGGAFVCFVHNQVMVGGELLQSQSFVSGEIMF